MRSIRPEILDQDFSVIEKNILSKIFFFEVFNFGLISTLKALMAGWGGETFSAGNYYFWIPLLSPMMGSCFGVVLYAIFISNNWPAH